MTKLKDLTPEQKAKFEIQTEEVFIKHQLEVEAMFEEWKKISQIITPPIFLAQQQLEHISRLIAAPALKAQESLNKIAQTFIPQLPSFAKQALEMAIAMEKWQEKSSLLERQLKKENIFLIPFFGALLNLSSLVEEINSNKTMIEIYDEFFSTEENLMQLYDSWMQNRFFHERSQIIKQCLIGHLNKQYELSIPVMYIQIEAICKKLLNIEGQVKYTELKKNLSEVYAPEPGSDGLIKYLSDEFAVEFITEQVFAHASSYSDLNIYPNRHEIIHGTDKTYYLKSHASLRCILLLDMLSAFEVKINKDQEN